ncbi:anhydro-N-acetylmuramic acid kinase [Alphaproteobacteria bacterium]|nr:anhydro-N-acetylmuramic acid kinase [Alphaproteobacteria bacterium]MDC1023067.1 anhydro-N-acetylmuramic acid kinase [Alphaproteobacteria bacterium]
MKYDYLNIIGLMTGTSMDGIDISLVQTNGLDLKRLNKNYFYEYSINTKKHLKNILNKDISVNLKRKHYLDEFVTNEHYLALKDLNIIETCDLIGFHGQTIYHNPKRKISIQLGDPKKLAKLLNKNVVFGFRSKDLELSGQGAPLAPIYHKYIIKKFNLTLPSCILNIGGVSNLTYWDGKKLIGFDTGPGNGLMDNYMSFISDKHFDKDGNLASKGTPDKKIIEKILNHDFFKKKPPKSLDKLSFKNFYNELLKKNYSETDIMATLAEVTVETIVSSLLLLPQTVKSILITGGGYRNIHLMKRLKDRLKLNFLNEEQLGINFDYIESELIAYLSARSVYNLPITFPETTGVLQPSSGGKLYGYL